MEKYERNFKIKKLPDNFNEWEKCILKQWFIEKPEDNIKFRFRLYNDNRFYIDSDKDGVKSSIKENYDNYKFLLDDIKYEKIIRYKYRYDDYLLSIDYLEYGNKIFEIESKNKEIIDNFIPYNWLDSEIK